MVVGEQQQHRKEVKIGDRQLRAVARHRRRRHRSALFCHPPALLDKQKPLTPLLPPLPPLLLQQHLSKKKK